MIKPGTAQLYGKVKRSKSLITIANDNKLLIVAILKSEIDTEAIGPVPLGAKCQAKIYTIDSTVRVGWLLTSTRIA